MAPRSGHDPTAPLIVGIGGLNLDYIVAEPGLDALAAADRRRFMAFFSPGSETTIRESDLRRLIDGLDPAHLTVRPGGSSFNMLAALARRYPEISLGFVGCVGDRPTPSPVLAALEDGRIDRRHVAISAGREHGSCLAIQIDGDRWLATARGANDDTARRLRDTREVIGDELARAGVVHVSSLLDDDAPSAVLAVLEHARERNPILKISFDPGAHWSRIAVNDVDVRHLGDMADWMFLNREEFDAWRDADLLDGCTGSIFRKAPGCIQVFARERGWRAPAVEVRQPVIAPGEIRDPTGAGDVFAAGALSALIHRPADTRSAAQTGLSWARAKLVGTG
jgi:sugar/nucleoside kinase (ribokinase family)